MGRSNTRGGVGVGVGVGVGLGVGVGVGWNEWRKGENQARGWGAGGAARG